jgi:hypothetical protein
MFGSRQSTSVTPTSLPAWNEQKKIREAARILTMRSCRGQVEAMMSCWDQNNIKSDEEQRLSSACTSSRQSLDRCMDSVDGEEVLRALEDISEKACPQQHSSMLSCVERYGQSNPDDCRREVISALACGANHFLSFQGLPKRSRVEPEDPHK